MAQIKTLDITPAQVRMPVIEISQYDVGRPIIVHMKDGSDWYDLTGLTVKLQGTKPSGFGYSVTGTVDGHDATFSTIYDMTSESGFIASEVSIIDGTDVIGSQNVMLHVEKSPHPPEIVDGSPETILPEMRELVERAETAAEILLDCSATATTLPTGSSATASYDAETGVFSFGIPQGAKGDIGSAGAKGDDGVGITSITKTGTSGLVDTYTITYTNGTTTTFTVTNGQNGTGSVADVWQNGVSVLDGSTAKVVVPTKTSDLTNDSGFVTSVPTKTSDLTNDSGYITSSALPTKVSDLTNDAGYITGYTETDPVFTASPAHGITSANITEWNGKATVSSVSVSLAVADWSSNSQTVSVTGVTASNSVIVSPAPASIDDYVAGGIKCTAQAAGTLTFTCTTTPSTAISVNVLVVS